MRESNSGILIGDLGLGLPLRSVLVLGRCHICGLLLEFLAVVVLGILIWDLVLYILIIIVAINCMELTYFINSLFIQIWMSDQSASGRCLLLSCPAIGSIMHLISSFRWIITAAAYVAMCQLPSTNMPTGCSPLYDLFSLPKFGFCKNYSYDSTHQTAYMDVFLKALAYVPMCQLPSTNMPAGCSS